MNWMPVPTELQFEDRTPLDRWYPNGVTQFGVDIIRQRLEPWALERELELERVRRDHYAYLPSRYSSVFACKSTDDIAMVRWQFFCPGFEGRRGRLWKIEGRAVFQADMNLFKQYNADMRTAATRYWSQQNSDEPLFEYLLEPPVTVLEEVVEAS
jgi:hypothetical protein